MCNSCQKSNEIENLFISLQWLLSTVLQQNENNPPFDDLVIGFINFWLQNIQKTNPHQMWVRREKVCNKTTLYEGHISMYHYVWMPILASHSHCPLPCQTSMIKVCGSSGLIMINDDTFLEARNQKLRSCTERWFQSITQLLVLHNNTTLR